MSKIIATIIKKNLAVIVIVRHRHTGQCYPKWYSTILALSYLSEAGENVIF